MRSILSVGDTPSQPELESFPPCLRSAWHDIEGTPRRHRDGGRCALRSKRPGPDRGAPPRAPRYPSLTSSMLLPSGSMRSTDWPAMFALMPSCEMPMELRCSDHAVSAPMSETASAMWSSAPGAPAATSRGQHDPEVPGRGVEGNVMPGVAPQLAQTERALVPIHAGIEVRDVQLEMGQSVDRQFAHLHHHHRKHRHRTEQPSALPAYLPERIRSIHAAGLQEPHING